MSSFKYNNVYIKDAYSVVGPYESKGQIKEFDYVFDILECGEKTFEKAEIKMQKKAIDSIMAKNYLIDNQVDCLIGGDLSNQLATSAVVASKYNIPFLGIYSACATFNEELIVASNLIESGLKTILTITSCHNLNSEKQFRYPVEYGAPKKECTTFTTTAAVSSILSTDKSNLKVESSTIGSVTDYGIKDANNMGAIMAPAAYQVLKQHLKDLNRKISYYDLVITGDLGRIGQELFKELLKKDNIFLKNYIDAGSEIYCDDQDVKAGASGPSSLPLILFNKIIKEGKYKKILTIATGSLHSPSLVNQKNTLPSVAHAVSLEVL